MPESAESFRLQGDLEREHPETEPLPPTPITPETYARFESWGIPEQFITRLQELTSSMRYDLCVQKAERVAQNKGYLFTSLDTDELILPDFFNYKNRLDGTCGDIAVQHLKLLHDTDYLAELNQILTTEGKRPIIPYLVSGQSRTHFDGDGAVHLWTGLLPEESPIEDMVTVDVSFQEISNTSENGYKTYRAAKLDTLDRSPKLAVPIMQSSEDETTKNVWLNPYNVLGLSADRQLVYSFGFFKDSSEKGISPVLEATLPAEPDDGKLPRGIVAEDGTVRFTNDDILTTLQRDEMTALLSTLQSMPIVDDNATAHHYRQLYEEVHFEPNPPEPPPPSQKSARSRISFFRRNR